MKKTSDAIQRLYKEYSKDELIEELVLLRKKLDELEDKQKEGSDTGDKQRENTKSIQNQKMELIGRLAGGIAHDFNNILTVIIGNLDILYLEENTLSKSVLEVVKDIKTSANKAAALTNQLLTFGRSHSVHYHIINMNSILGNLERMLRRIIGENISLEIRCDKGIKNIKADPRQLEQVIMNLVVNARDAVGEQGKILIRTSEQYIIGKKGYIKDDKEGDFIVLSVTDNGRGMDKQTCDHIFEPFFTTKDSEGTGLGLATVYTVLKDNNGDIDVDSKEGLGTTFSVYLPSVDEDVTAVQHKDIPTVSGDETLLVVEDETSMRTIISRILTVLGYKVLTAENGEEAVKILKNHQVDLIISDLVMPGMSGKELANVVCKSYPNIKMLYMTGYTDNIIERYGICGEEEVKLLRKPFSSQELSCRVRKVLDMEQISSNDT